jgi:hypothetical protein
MKSRKNPDLEAAMRELLDRLMVDILRALGVVPQPVRLDKEEEEGKE